MPRDMTSFIKSYLEATEENTLPTSLAFSSTGTTLDPKWVVAAALVARDLTDCLNMALFSVVGCSSL